jgi:hypothetical protein
MLFRKVTISCYDSHRKQIDCVQNLVFFFIFFKAGDTCCEKNTALCVGGTRVTHLLHNIDWYILNPFVLMCYSDYICHFSERSHTANMIFKAYLLL